MMLQPQAQGRAPPSPPSLERKGSGGRGHSRRRKPYPWSDVLNKRVNFRTSWNIWVDHAAPDQGTAKGGFEQSLKKAGHVSISNSKDLEKFWSGFCSVQYEQECTNLRIFREGVTPTWEDSGAHGKFVYATSKRYTKVKLFALIRSLLMDVFSRSDDLCGIVLSSRTRKDFLALWNMDASSDNALTRTKTELYAVLDVASDTDRIDYLSFESRGKSPPCSPDKLPRLQRPHSWHDAKDWRCSEDRVPVSTPLEVRQKQAGRAALGAKLKYGSKADPIPADDAGSEAAEPAATWGDRAPAAGPLYESASPSSGISSPDQTSEGLEDDCSVDASPSASPGSCGREEFVGCDGSEEMPAAECRATAPAKLSKPLVLSAEHVEEMDAGTERSEDAATLAGVDIGAVDQDSAVEKKSGGWTMDSQYALSLGAALLISSSTGMLAYYLLPMQ